MTGQLLLRSVAGLGLLAVLVGCFGGPEAADEERAPLLPSSTTAPGAQRLSVAFDVPGTQGAALMLLGSAEPKIISTEIRPEPVVEFSISVLDVFADEDAVVDLRELTVLRVPTDESYPDAPVLRPGDVVFAIYRDQGLLAGGNSKTRVVASTEADIVRVLGSGVTGPVEVGDLDNAQATWLGYTEPFDAMRARFARQAVAASPRPSATP